MAIKKTKEMKKIASILIGLTVLGSAPVVPVETQLTYLYSQENLLFNTPSGDLGVGEYAKFQDGYLIRTQPSEEASWEFVEKDFDVSKLTEVSISDEKGANYEFYTDGKKNYRYRMTKEDYDDVFQGRKSSPTATTTLKFDSPAELILGANQAFADIALDATTTSSDQGTASSYSWSHTTTGANTGLVVCPNVRGTGAQASGITYGGIAMDKVTIITLGTSNIQVFKKTTPSSGSNTVAVTLAAAPTNSISFAESYTGVDQTSLIEASSTASGITTDTPSVSVTTLSNNAWVVDCGTWNNGSAGTVGAGQTKNYDIVWSSGIRTAFSSYEPKATPGAVTMSWTITAASWATIGFSLKPTVVSGNNRVDVWGPVNVGAKVNISQ